MGSIAKDLIVRMVNHMTIRKSNLFAACEKMVRQYRLRGFLLKYIWADNEFEPLREEILSIGVTLYICAANEHIAFMERDVRTVKQRYRAIGHDLSYVTMPSLMVVYFVMFVYFWLNAFPPENGVSDKVAPGEFIGGRVLDFNKHCGAVFGSHVQTHEDNYPKNSMQSITLGIITLGPDSSARGGYYFMNFKTGMRIHCITWTALSMPDEVIKRVEQ